MTGCSPAAWPGVGQTVPLTHSELQGQLHCHSLVDGAARMVGINTATISPAQGICFAIGIDTAIWVATRLMRDGQVRCSRLGLSGQTVPVSTRVRRFHRLEQTSGVQVLDVQADWTAARGGMVAGDVILSFAEISIPAVDDMHRARTAERVGEQVEIQVLRRSERVRLTVSSCEASSGGQKAR